MIVRVKNDTNINDDIRYSYNDILLRPGIYRNVDSTKGVNIVVIDGGDTRENIALFVGPELVEAPNKNWESVTFIEVNKKIIIEFDNTK